jgi:hypothetical protein
MKEDGFIVSTPGKELAYSAHVTGFQDQPLLGKVNGVQCPRKELVVVVGSAHIWRRCISFPNMPPLYPNPPSRALKQSMRPNMSFAEFEGDHES